jgi:predicted TIM-barrel fold metal-dependent hydrolase
VDPRHAGGAADLLLRDFAPHPALRVPVTEVERPRFPVVDAHAHLAPPFGGDWAARPDEELLAELDAAGVETLVDLDGGWGDRLRAEIERWQVPHPGRIAVFATMDHDFASEDRFGEREARRLRDAAAAGARGLKVWKLLGLRSRDARGRLVAVDDERLDPVWAEAAALRLPVLIHVADPIAFFDPLDRHNERWEELRLHPDWHCWPTRPIGAWPDDPRFPTFDELMAQLWRMVERHPRTTFVGAHVGCAAEDLGFVSAMLEACPNWHVDLAARLGEIGRQPYTARDFIVRWADRVLFGTDGDPDRAVYRTWYRFLETADEHMPYGAEEIPPQGRWAVHGLALPDDVLRKVYAGNARRVLLHPTW